MYFEVQRNLLPIESIQEFDGWVYGILSRTAPIYFLLRERAKDIAVDYLKFQLLFNDYIHPQVPEAALLEFVSLKEGDPEQATYLRQYGLLSLQDLRIEGLPKTIKVYCDDASENGLVAFALNLGELWRWRESFTKLLTLTRAALEKDERTAQAIAETLDKHTSSSNIVANLYHGNWLQYAKDGFRTLVVGTQLSSLQFGAREKNGRIVPLIASYGVLETLGLLLLDHLHRETRLGECQNPQCKKLFFVTKKSKKCRRSIAAQDAKH